MNALEAAKGRMHTLLEEARGLQKAHADGSITDEQRTRAAALKGEIEEVGREIDRIKESEGTFSQLGSLVAHLTSQPAKKVPGITESGEPGERRDATAASWRSFINSAGYKRVRETGMGQTGMQPITLKRTGDGVILRGDESPDELKTLIYTGATGSLIPAQRVPGIWRGDPMDLMVRDAFLGARTNSTSMSWVKENVVTNSVAGFVEASTAGSSPGTSSADFPESAITFTVASETVKSIGHMIPVTREMLDDVALFESYLTARAEEMLNEKIDGQLLTGAGSNDLTGLYNVSGITDLDASYFSTNPVKSAGEPAENLGRIRRARTYHRVTNKARASHVLIHPYDLEDLAETRDADGNYMFPNGVPNIGMTWIESESATQASPIVLDRRHVAVFDKMENQIEVTDSNREFFEFRILTLAVWTRLALVPFRPAAIAKVAFA